MVSPETRFLLVGKTGSSRSGFTAGVARRGGAVVPNKRRRATSSLTPAARSSTRVPPLPATPRASSRHRHDHSLLTHPRAAPAPALSLRAAARRAAPRDQGARGKHARPRPQLWRWLSGHRRTGAARRRCRSARERVRCERASGSVQRWRELGRSSRNERADRGARRPEVRAVGGDCGRRITRGSGTGGIGGIVSSLEVPLAIRRLFGPILPGAQGDPLRVHSHRVPDSAAWNYLTKYTSSSSTR